MLLIKDATVLAISTVLDSANVYSRLMEKINPVTGRSYFQTARVNLKCTDASCAAAGNLCRHNAHLVPSWHSIGAHDAARDLLSDSPTVRDRELEGQVADDGSPLFQPELVDTAFALPTMSASGPIRFGVVAVDPSNGGRSEYSIVSAVYSDRRMIILGMDTAGGLQVEAMERIFKDHVRTLVKMLRGTFIVLAVEANNGADIPGLHENWMSGVGLVEGADFVSLRERGGSGPAGRIARGIWTTNALKECATSDFRQSLKDGRVRLAMKHFSVGGLDAPTEAKAQLKRWSKVVTQVRSTSGATTSHIGGKGASFALNDDLAMCLILNHAVSRMLMGPCAARYAAVAGRAGILFD
jgi:hypothetical protein